MNREEAIKLLNKFQYLTDEDSIVSTPTNREYRRDKHFLEIDEDSPSVERYTIGELKKIANG